ncbi:MAG: hypothetical protein Q8N13_01310 [Acidovorax sp.]|nr:hypothetical protein [Acidovorax sp.]
MPLLSSFSAGALALVLGLAAFMPFVPMSALADDGHNHGEAPAAAAGPASPRFAATSDLFELVGVLDGQTLALYLDHAGDNSPVRDAQLELEVSGVRVPVTRVADGEFQAALAAPLAEGVSPVTATVVAGNESDLLAGEIDVHAAEHAHTETASGSRAQWLGGGVAAVLLALAAAWGLRSGRTARAGRLGGAA